jgi:hypothetical protein
MWNKVATKHFMVVPWHFSGGTGYPVIWLWFLVHMQTLSVENNNFFVTFIPYSLTSFPVFFSCLYLFPPVPLFFTRPLYLSILSSFLASSFRPLLYGKTATLNISRNMSLQKKKKKKSNQSDTLHATLFERFTHVSILCQCQWPFIQNL